MTATIAIGIATYRRPDLLSQLLASLHSMRTTHEFTVYVVDNDDRASAASVVEPYAEIVRKYVWEERPGIAQARNRFLDELGEEGLIVFIDDDERVDPTWLDRLVNAQTAFNADVVWGPVIPEFPPDAPSWAIEGRFFERARHVTGTRLTTAATNNVLVRRDALERLANPRFDTRYSATGGSDSELFGRLSRSGACIVWCDEAIVREAVPTSRMTWDWVRRRAERTGNVRARLLMSDGKRSRVLLEGVARLGVGGAKMTWRRATRREQNAWALNPWMRGIGMLRALRGALVREYERVPE